MPSCKSRSSSIRITRLGRVDDEVGAALLIGCGSAQSMSRPSNWVIHVSSE
ncbi:hypothetical protein ACWGKK_45375 [Streptomyces chartreusis]|uniref:hypothetical protein n=1 Tax=Streptomyces sp. PAN_FS17 TaxID=1855351 RepID=UPI00210C4464|nr:hypothetical protein [Streptomyces sp. PAN_FS17]